MSSLSVNPKDLWFQDDEYEMILKRAALLVTLIQSNNGHTVVPSNKNKKYCIRGLERCIDPESASTNRYNAWDAVMEEQDLQRRHQRPFDDVYIARLYSLQSYNSSIEAAKLGTKDAQVIKEYLQDTRMACRVMNLSPFLD